jgi:Fur family ferric uptake transcriptional regulator
LILSINYYIFMELKEILKKAWKSFTEEREVIFQAIKNLHHFDYLDLQDYLNIQNINIWRASIFRTLNLFKEIWILENICNKSGVIIYEYIDENNHHEHMKCKNCWKIIEFDDTEIHKYLEKIAKKNNFKLLKHSINLEGLCDECNI